MRKLVILAVLVAALTALAAVGVVSAGDDDGTVLTEGECGVEPNEIVFCTLRFSPGDITVNSGDTVTFAHADDTEDPHTITIVDPADLPTTFDEVFACEAGLCGAILGAHFGPPFTPVLEDDADAEFGLDGPGDSLLFFHGGPPAQATITAAPGTTLFYLCAIHPWMQGTIEVESDDD